MLVNSITKREFFRIVFGAIATSTLLSSPLVAEACEQVEANKITATIAKARTVIATSDYVIASDLISYMLANFDSGSTHGQEVNTYLTSPEKLGVKGDVLTYEELERLTDGLIPVAVMRELVGKHRVIVCSRVTNFDHFAIKYQKLFSYTLNNGSGRFDMISPTITPSDVANWIVTICLLRPYSLQPYSSEVRFSAKYLRM